MLINNKSDFKIVEVMDGVQTIPPFKFVYHTDHPTHPYTASYDGIRWKNCKQGATPTSVLVVFDIKGLGSVCRGEERKRVHKGCHRGDRILVRGHYGRRAEADRFV